MPIFPLPPISVLCPKNIRFRQTRLIAQAVFLLLLFLLPSQVNAQKNASQQKSHLRIVDLNTIDLLDMLESLTGKEILRRTDIANTPFNFKSINPMTDEEKISAIENLLGLNGILLSDIDDRFRKASPAVTGKQQIPILLTKSTLEMRPSQNIYSKIFHLEYLTTEEIMSLIQVLFNQETGPNLFERNNSLMVTDALINLQAIERMISKYDRPGKPVQEMNIIKMQHASATEVVARLKTLQESNTLRTQLQSSVFEADERTNKLITFTPPGAMAIVETFIKQFDVSVAPITKAEVFPLKYAEAKDIHAILEEIITQQAEAREDSSSKKLKKDNTQKPGSPQEKPLPDAIARLINPDTPTPTSQENAAGAESESSAVTLQFSSYVSIVADERTNSIIASGTKNDHKILAALLEKIDSFLPQVRIEVIITEVTFSENESNGIASFLANYNQENSNEVAFEVTPSAVAELTSPFTLSGTLKEFSLVSAINIARNKSNVEILSMPTLTTMHNGEAEIEIGESRPIITGSFQETIRQSATQLQIQYQNISLKLKIKPKIGSDGSITLEVEQTAQSIIDFVTVDGNQQPVIGERVSNSTVTVEDGEVIILGGMQKHEENDEDGRLSFIGRVPIISGLLAPQSKGKKKSDLILFIKPTVFYKPNQAGTDASKKFKSINPTHSPLDPTPSQNP